jgi:hypothetical protein
LLLPSGDILAQEKSLSFRFGPGHIARQDQIFSPFNHTDWSLVNTGIRYESRNRFHQWIDLGVGSYNPILVPSYSFGDDEQTYPHSFLLVNLTYALGKLISSANSAGRWTAGGFVENDIQPSSYNYGHVGSFGYFASIGLGAWARYEYNLNKQNSLSLTAQLPLAALVARSPYLVNDDEFIENTSSHNGLKTFLAFLGDGEIQTLNRMQQMELHVTFTHAFNNKWKLGCWYELHVLHVREPLPLIQFRNVLNVTATLTF